MDTTENMITRKFGTIRDLCTYAKEIPHDHEFVRRCAVLALQAEQGIKEILEMLKPPLTTETELEQ